MVGKVGLGTRLLLWWWMSTARLSATFFTCNISLDLYYNPAWKVRENQEFPGGLAIKDLALSPLWRGFNPWPGNAAQKKKTFPVVKYSLAVQRCQRPPKCKWGEMTWRWPWTSGVPSVGFRFSMYPLRKLHPIVSKGFLGSHSDATES